MSYSLNDLKRIQKDDDSLKEFSEKLCYHTDITAYFSALKIKDKKELLKSIESKDEEAINRNFDRIIEKYVKFDPDISTDDLTVQERYQILTYMRRAAAGDSVKIAHQCPECEKINSDIEYDLNNMEVTYFDKDNELETSIKVSKKISVHLGPMTRKDEREVETLIKKRKVKSVTERQIISLIGIIKKVEIEEEDIVGEVKLTPSEKLEFFEELNQSIIDDMIEYMKKIENGVKLPFSFNCEFCDYANEEEEASVAAFFIS
jgi:hypothetical protein